MAAADRTRNIVPPWQREKAPVARMLIRNPAPLEWVGGFVETCQATRLHRIKGGNYDTLLRCDSGARHSGRHTDSRWNCAWGRGRRAHTHVTEL